MSTASQSSLEIKRRFLFGRYDSTYFLDVALSEFNLPPFADALINCALPREIVSHDLLQDIKGADEPNEELLRICGKVWRGDHRNAAEPAHFSVVASTKFHEFVGTHHISHAVHIKWLGLGADEVPLPAIARAFPLRIESLKLQLQFFESQRTIMLGFMPTVTRSIVLKWEHEKLELTLAAEGLPTRSTLPFGKFTVLDGVVKVIKQQLGFDIVADWRGKVGNLT